MKIDGYITDMPKKAIKKLSQNMKMMVAGTMIVGSMGASADFNNDYGFEGAGFNLGDGYIAESLGGVEEKVKLVTGDGEMDVSKDLMLKVLEERTNYMQEREIEKTFQFLADFAAEEFAGQKDMRMSVDAKQHLIGSFMLDKGNIHSDISWYTSIIGNYSDAVEAYKDAVTREVAYFNNDYNMNYNQPMAKKVTVGAFYENHDAIKQMDVSYKNMVSEISDPLEKKLHEQFSEYNSDEMSHILYEVRKNHASEVTIGSAGKRKNRKIKNSFKSI